MPLVIKFSKSTKGHENSVKRPILLVNVHTSPICSFLDLAQTFLYLWVREVCVVCATPSPPVTHGSGGPPMPGRTGTAVRVDQAGAGPFHPWTQDDDVSKFFDPTRYRGRMVQPQMPRGTLGGEMHTTRANILKFFDTEQYHNSGVVSQSQTGVPLVSNEQHATQRDVEAFFSPATYQKRGAEQPAHASSPVPMAKAKRSPSDLIEKFQLAATLNGIDWKELADS